MKLAVLHYHLNPGGVTKVIANHLTSLDAVLPPESTTPVLVLCDGQTSGWPLAEVERLVRLDVLLVAVPALGYDVEPVAESDRLANELRDILKRHAFAPGDTVIHAHNHSVGKNASLPGALRRLADDGYSLLLQLHDFAEDFRPANYRHLRTALTTDDLSDDLYFQSPHVHYATLNRRDFEVLAGAGMSAERLHFLPNPVPDLEELPSREHARAALAERWGVRSDEEYVLYPVRGIRRKNLGEMLLLSVLQNADDGPTTWFGLTLAPQNPVALSYYKQWLEFASELRLPCLFDTGGDGGLSFPENLAAADRILTTSVAEGFGMVFLESWLAGRPLVGRNLPEITADFVDAGLCLDHLYDRLAVPVDWVGRDNVVAAMESACRQMFADYGLPAASSAEIRAAVDRATDDGTIDFGRLDEPLQEQVIRLVADDAGRCDEIQQLNPELSQWDTISAEAITANQEVIRANYSRAASGTRLLSVYDAVLNSRHDDDVETSADGGAIQKAFLDLDRFRMIRT